MEWQSEYNKMREFLKQAAKEVFTDKEDIWQKYVRSGEGEIIVKNVIFNNKLSACAQRS